MNTVGSMAPASAAVPAVVSAPRICQSSRRGHSLRSDCANSAASSAGERSDIPACCRPVAGLLLADSAGTTGGRSCMVSSEQLPPDVLKFFQDAGRKGGKRGGSIGGKRRLETMTSEERTARAKEDRGGKREGAEAEGGVMRVTQPAACFQSRRTELPCRTCGERPSVVHFPTRYVGYYCEKCCPACRQKPAAKGE